MTRYHRERTWAYVVLALLFVLAVIAWSPRARSDDAPTYPCPTKEPCKVITITQEESNSLTNALFPAALWANRTMIELVEMWRNKIAAAPAGKVQEPKPESQPAPAKPADKK